MLPRGHNRRHRAVEHLVSHRPADARGGCRDDCGRCQSQHIVGPVEAERSTEIALDQPCGQQGFARIAESEGSGAPEVPVARNIGNDGRNNHATGDRQSCVAPERDQHAGGHARSRPDDAVGISRVYITVRKPVGVRASSRRRPPRRYPQETITTAVIDNELAPPTPAPVGEEAAPKRTWRPRSSVISTSVSAASATACRRPVSIIVSCGRSNIRCSRPHLQRLAATKFAPPICWASIATRYARKIRDLEIQVIRTSG